MLLALSASTLMLLFFFQEYFYLDAAKIIAAEALRYIEINRLQGALIFMAFYFSICALPTPFVSAPTMLAGYLFGNIDGLLIVSFMSALGGTCLFLMARYLCRNWIQKNFTEKFSRLSKVSNANSFSAALSMRLIPGMPFSIPAIALGLSQLSTLKFYCSTQLGLLMILFVYVNAGRSLAEISSVADIFTAQLIISMLLLAIVPLTFAFIARKRKPAFSS
jgi:uncharacterized membrane protein YdjX (TVP38/TMEM64 family)